MKTLSLLAVLVVSLPSARAAYVHAKYALEYVPFPGGPSPIPITTGYFMIDYDDSFATITGTSGGIRNFSLITPGFTTNFVIDGVDLWHRRNFSLDTASHELRLTSFFGIGAVGGYGLANSGPGHVMEMIHYPSNSFSTAFAPVTRIRHLGVPDGGCTVYLLGAALLGLGWKRRCHG